MERATRGAGNDDTSQPLPLTGQRLTIEPMLPEDPSEELPDLEEPETPAMPGYLTLEMDVSELQAFAADVDPATCQPDQSMREYQEPAVEELDLDMLELFTPEEGLDLDMPALLAPEELSSPGYLTLEIDIEALENESPEQSSSDREYRARQGHP